MPLLAILSWPLIALIFFAQMPFARALVVSTLVGYLLLPERFDVDLPGLPAMGMADVGGDGFGQSSDPVERLRNMIGERQEETVEILRSWLEEDEERA